ncbi:MAG: helix-turn-helix transcriptional regulator [Candidatus Nealsonbacteria bacterium DGGOD1a]|jgi:Predicted transcriptional regulator with C-terminal CBS domains|nr:MAG: helix-turn-helix transcriptional regulator [Candidatus Nealsonbacteria bacterium DGGOD1a]
MLNLADNLKRLRKAKNLTQEKLARLADLTNNTIIKIEAGKNQNPTLATLKSISKALDISVNELIK